jgi:hypothetical protein
MASGLHNKFEEGKNYGDIPAHFKVIQETIGSGEHVFKVSENEITVTIPSGVSYSNFEWDSRTGIVSGLNGDKKLTLLPYTGNPCGTIPVTTSDTQHNINIGGAKLLYHYWYY